MLIACIMGRPRVSFDTCVYLLLPSLVSVVVLFMNRHYKQQAAIITYLFVSPIITSCIYTRGMNFGLELNFILYGILSVFFLIDLGVMLFSIALSMVSYFVLAILWEGYNFQLAVVAPGMYMFIQCVLILMIFYGLYLIKYENAQFQLRILSKHRELKLKKLEIERINTEIEEKARQLEELDALKNKLFSVISHDLKAPMHALKNVFNYMNNHDMPAREIKAMIPDVVTDVNNTTELMDNLLQWARSQMGGATVYIDTIDMYKLTDEILRLHRPLAQNKNITIESHITPGLAANGDLDMIKLVFRNLISNAIKYTPASGKIVLDATWEDGRVEIFVRDNGIGMNAETLNRINEAKFFSSAGTSNETGTGLGLMLCREFIAKNGGQLNVISQPGKGSCFSFTLNAAERIQPEGEIEKPDTPAPSRPVKSIVPRKKVG
jgi:signal transduction histidine kinase